LVTDRLHSPGDFSGKLNEAIIAGVDAVQLREKDLSGGSYLQLAQAVKQMTDSQNIPLLINERVDVAIAASCRGVHLGGNSFPLGVVRNFLGSQYLIGKSTHQLEEALSAASDGADYITFGPVYETPSKRKYGAPQGIEKLRVICQKSPIPVFAIGGITESRVKPVMDSGAHGIAVISAVFQASDVSGTVIKFKDALSEYY
ncbi:MAG: thiamine-phosphate diphosphorylase, partial [Candidatus Schekmanbacteria bacterium RBG_13_48_7]